MSAQPTRKGAISRGTQKAVGLWRLVVSVVIGFRGEALALRAGNLTFITITSLVPLVAVIFSLLHAFNANRIDPLVVSFFEDVLSPGGRLQSEQFMRSFLTAANSRVAGGVSFIVVLVSAGAMLRHLDASLNDIWRVRTRRPILVSVGLYAGVLLIGPLLFAVSLLGSEGVRRFLGWLDFRFASQALFFGSLMAASVLFSLLYKIAPHAPVPWKSALLGGSVAGIAWEIARNVYGGIAGFFFSANKLYGSLGIAPLFLMWIYVSWYILLSGARLAYAYEHKDFHDEFSDLLEHPRSNELIASRIAEEIAKAEVEDHAAPTNRELSALLHLPEQRVRELVAMLVSSGLISLNLRGGLKPARELATLTLADISAAVGGTVHVAAKERAGGYGDVAKLFSSADESTIEKLKGISWADLAQHGASKNEKP